MNSYTNTYTYTKGKHTLNGGGNDDKVDFIFIMAKKLITKLLFSVAESTRIYLAAIGFFAVSLPFCFSTYLIYSVHSVFFIRKNKHPHSSKINSFAWTENKLLKNSLFSLIK